MTSVRRTIKNVVKNYTQPEVKVREATSNDPWGPPSNLMAEISEFTYNPITEIQVMSMLWKRLNDNGKNWRHVYKALVLLEYLLRHGSERVAEHCRENLFQIQTLRDFQFVEDNKDLGMNVREKAKSVVAILKDAERLSQERVKAAETKKRFADGGGFGSGVPQRQASRYMGAHEEFPASRSGYNLRNGMGAGNYSPPMHRVSRDAESTRPRDLGGFGTSGGAPVERRTSNLGAAGAGSTRRRSLGDMENARPSNAQEEALQMQLALEMSRQEAEMADKVRREEDVKLQLALEASMRNSGKLTTQQVPGSTNTTTSTDPSASGRLRGPPATVRRGHQAAVPSPAQTVFTQPEPAGAAGMLLDIDDGPAPQAGPGGRAGSDFTLPSGASNADILKNALADPWAASNATASAPAFDPFGKPSNSFARGGAGGATGGENPFLTGNWETFDRTGPSAGARPAPEVSTSVFPSAAFDRKPAEAGTGAGAMSAMQGDGTSFDILSYRNPSRAATVRNRNSAGFAEDDWTLIGSSNASKGTGDAVVPKDPFAFDAFSAGLNASTGGELSKTKSGSVPNLVSGGGGLSLFESNTDDFDAKAAADKKKTAADFLGQDTRLVNLDNLVPKPPAGSSNPFALTSSSPLAPNPFAVAPSKVPMSQLAKSPAPSGFGTPSPQSSSINPPAAAAGGLPPPLISLPSQPQPQPQVQTGFGMGVGIGMAPMSMQMGYGAPYGQMGMMAPPPYGYQPPMTAQPMGAIGYAPQQRPPF